MIDLIWITMILASLVFSFVNGSISEVSNSLFEGAKTAVTISISLLGSMCFWLGITEIITESGLSKKISNFLMPIINWLFPKYKDNSDIKEKISLNFTANLLGLGNASTPLGLSALNSMTKIEGERDMPSKECILFVVINTASLQILPTSMAGLRSSFGSTSPFSILVPVWVVSFATILVVVVLCKVLGRD